MTLDKNIYTTKRDLIRAFAMFDAWFDKDEGFHRYRPPGQGDAIDTQIRRIAKIATGLMEALCDHRAAWKSSIQHIVVEDAKQLVYLYEEMVPHIGGSHCAKTLHETRALFRDALDRGLCELELALLSETLSTGDALEDVIGYLQRQIMKIAKYLNDHHEQLDTVENIYRIQLS